MKQLMIGDVARATGLTPATIRFYEEEGVLPPVRRLGNRRRAYDVATLDRLSFVQNCRAAGMRLDAIRELLVLAHNDAQACAGVHRVAGDALKELTGRIAGLQKARLQLAKMVAACNVTACGVAGHSCTALSGATSAT